MKKWLVGLFSCFLFSFIAWQLASATIQWYLQKKISEHFAADIQIGSYHFKASGLYFKNIHLTSHKYSEEEGYHLFIPQMHISLAALLWKQEVAIEVSVEKPIVTFNSRPQVLDHSLFQGSAESPFLHLTSYISVQDGTIIYTHYPKVAFALNLKVNATVEGHIDLKFADSYQRESFLNMQLSHADTIILDVIAQKANIKELADLMQFFTGYRSDILLSKGLATGYLKLSLNDKNYMTPLQGYIVLSDLLAYHQAWKKEMHLPEMICAFEEDLLSKHTEPTIKGFLNAAANNLEFYASFGQHKAFIKYILNKCTYEDENFLLAFDNNQQKISGFYNFNLDGGLNSGELIIRHASLIEKHSGLQLTNLAAKICCQGESFIFNELSAKGCFRDAIPFKLENMHIDVIYNQAQEHLLCRHITGEVNVAPYPHTYLIKNSSLQLSKKPQNALIFELNVAYGDIEIFSLVGQKTYNLDQWAFDFDNHKTKILGLCPTSMQLSLTDNYHIQKFHIHLPLQLDVVKEPLAQLAAVDMFDVLGLKTSHLHSLQAYAGNYDCHLTYENQVFTYHVQGDNCCLDGFTMEKFILKGRKDKALWAIDLCSLDDISISADIVQEPARWVVNFVGVQLGHKLLIGIQHPYSIEMFADQRLIIRKLNTHVEEQSKNELFYQGPNTPYLSVASAEWLGCSNQLKVDDLEFEMHPEQAAIIINKLHYLFPYRFDASLADLILKAKKTGSFKGKLQLKSSLAGDFCRLELAKGFYLWQEAEYHINSFALESDHKEFKVLLNFMFKDKPLWSFVHTNKDLSEGNIYFSNMLFQHTFLMQHPEILRIDWHRDSKVGIAVDKVQGRLYGMDILLKPDPVALCRDDAVPLVGSIALDLSKELLLLPQSLQASIINCKLAGLYKFSGRWNFKKKWKPHDSYFTFQGLLSAQSVACQGYLFNSLTSQVDFKGHSFVLSKGSVHDSAGRLEINKAIFSPTELGTWLSIDTLQVTNFKPSLLKGSHTALTAAKQLLLEINMHNVCGYLHDPFSFRAKGSLNFNNPTDKKSWLHSLFVIPLEIIQRIGLNLSLLNPASGTIAFNLLQGKFFLTNFKNVYSAGYFSRFYLKKPAISYVDIDGNLDIQLRIRHYNLLFKLTELFTINVFGSLNHPIYSLKKHKK